MPHQQIPCSHTLADSFSLLALFSTRPSFVFSSLRTLFAKYPGWGWLCNISALSAPAHSAVASQRYHFPFFAVPLFSSTYKSPLDAHRFATFSVFMHLQIPFSATSLYSQLYKTPGCHPHLTTFLPIRRGSASRQSTATRDVFHTSFLVYAQRSRGAFATFPNPCYRARQQGGFAKCQ